jgi:hypothetical protein
MLVVQFVQRRHKCRLPHNPCAVFRNLLVARAVSANDEPKVAPFAGATRVNAIQPRALADLSGIEKLAHRRLPLSGRPIRVAGAVPFLQCCDGGFELGRDLGALATGQAAAQLGPQFLDVVLKRDHRPLLLFEDGAGAPRRSGRVKDAEGAAERGAEEPILSRV